MSLFIRVFTRTAVWKSVRKLFALQMSIDIFFRKCFLLNFFLRTFSFVFKENGRTFKKISSGIVNVSCNSNQNETQGNLEIPKSVGKVGIKL